jgi:hypothetical protein
MTLFRRALALVSPRWRTSSPCEGCGNDFTCGASLTGCWCLQVKLGDDARADLREKYRKCVCRACLERTASATGPSSGRGSLNQVSR